MIYVQQQPEPVNFDRDVRQRGLQALAAYSVAHATPPTKRTFWRYHDYWKNCHDDLMCAYNRTCAYLAIRLFRVKMAENTKYHSSIEHFIPKEENISLAYEWNNYLLVSALANNKRDKDKILDPRIIPHDLFRLSLKSGVMRVNSQHLPEIQEQAELTIGNIDLNGKIFCDLRALLYNHYKNNPQKLKEMSPFIYNEAVRQGKIDAV